MTDRILKLIDPSTNAEKFYRLILPKGSHEVLCQWGRIGVWIEEQWVPCKSHKAAQEWYARKLSEKEREGYLPADWGVLPTNYRIYGRKRTKVDPVALPGQHPGQLNWLTLLDPNSA